MKREEDRAGDGSRPNCSARATAQRINEKEDGEPSVDPHSLCDSLHTASLKAPIPPNQRAQKRSGLRIVESPQEWTDLGSGFDQVETNLLNQTIPFLSTTRQSRKLHKPTRVEPLEVGRQPRPVHPPAELRQRITHEVIGHALVYGDHEQRTVWAKDSSDLRKCATVVKLLPVFDQTVREVQKDGLEGTRRERQPFA